MEETQAKKLDDLPPLYCPDCGENILPGYWYNFCEEVTELREDNYLWDCAGRIYVDHETDHNETLGHECALDCFCGHCDRVLPWGTHVLRGALEGPFDEVCKEIHQLTQESEVHNETTTERAVTG